MATICNIDWEALATFSTGVMAVGAALFVGNNQLKILIRQSDIMDKQADVQNEQARIAEVTLRHELFERRMQVHEAVADYLAAAWRNLEGDEFRKAFVGYVKAMLQSRFLFTKEIVDKIDEINIIVNEQRRVIRPEEEEFNNKYLDEDQRMNAVASAYGKLDERMKSLNEIFGDEMDLFLTDVPASLAREKPAFNQKQ